MNSNSPLWPVQDAASHPLPSPEPKKKLAVVRIYTRVDYFEDTRLEVPWRDNKSLTVAQLYDHALQGYWIKRCIIPRENVRYISVGDPFIEE